EHIVHGESGLLAAFGDAGAFERAAVALAAEPGRAAALGRNARQAAQRIDWDSVIDLFVQELAARS
ncbi:MAG TPA: glycosyltransferase family 1 protein, partial [Burkholderiales bacterium]|nr:glycosyltransferase family 1 protein [Burkholderiales bacterium]